MLLSESAVDTLARNSLIGLFELVVDEVFELLVDEAFEPVSFSTVARYFLASLVSPDLMAENRLVSALLSEFWLFLEVLEVDDVEEAVSSVSKAELLCIEEIDMACDPFPADFPERRPR